MIVVLEVVMLVSTGAVLSMDTMLDSVTLALVLPAASLNAPPLTLNVLLEFPVDVFLYVAVQVKPPLLDARLLKFVPAVAP